MKKEHSQQVRIIRKPEMFKLTGLSDATLWRMEKKKKFPKRVKLGGNSVGWLSSEYDLWIEQKAAERG
jgi:prophage regulatory protein